jgi:hypothetical protein
MGCPSGILPLEFSPWQSMNNLADLFENFFFFNQTLGAYSRGQGRILEPVVASIAAILWPLQKSRFFNIHYALQTHRFASKMVSIFQLGPGNM